MYDATDKPSVVQRTSAPMNYALCQPPRRAMETTSPFHTADPLVWLVLITCLIFVSLVVGLSIKKITSQIFLVALSPLVSGGISVKSKTLRHSLLLTLWMYVSLVFATYYSGNLTSHVISPLKEFRLTKVSDLMEHNFTLIARSKFVYQNMKDLVKMTGNQEHARVLEPLTASTVVSPSDAELPKMVATMDKRACISPWPGAMQAASRAGDYLRKINSEKRCYLGKLFFDLNVFITLTPPRSKRLAEIVEVMMEAGFFNAWFNEFAELAVSSRAQERSKMISRTTIKEEKPPPSALKLKNVFVLWVTCIAISFGIWALENVRKTRVRAIS